MKNPALPLDRPDPSWHPASPTYRTRYDPDDLSGFEHDTRREIAAVARELAMHIYNAEVNGVTLPPLADIGMDYEPVAGALPGWADDLERHEQ